MKYETGLEQTVGSSFAGQVYFKLLFKIIFPDKGWRWLTLVTTALASQPWILSGLSGLGPICSHLEISLKVHLRLG